MSQAEKITLKASLRDGRGSAIARRLRREGLVPAVLYGHKEGTVSISVPQRELAAALRTGTQTVALELGGKEERALIKDAQYDPLSLALLHVDFARVALDEKVIVSVPIEMSGTPKGASEDGVLDLVLKELEVECLVTNIPTEIKIRVHDLDIGDSIAVQDLDLPVGVVPAPDVEPETVVVTVHAPRKGLEEEETEGEALEAALEESAQPEVIGEKEREERAESKEDEKEE